MDRMDQPAEPMLETVAPRELWRQIERDARDTVSSRIDALLATPLVFGEHIAWVTTVFARTDALSPVHRVGFPQADIPFTTCGEVIPHPFHWLPLSPALIRTMDPCRFCEAEYRRNGEANHAA